MNRFVRALGALFAALALIYAADVALLKWWTDDSAIYRLDQVATPTVPLEEAVGSVSSDVLKPTNVQNANQEEIDRARTYDGFATWAMSTIFAAGFALLGWFLAVFARERRNFGPRTQSSGWPYWVATMLIYGSGCVALYFWLFTPHGVSDLIYETDYYILLGLIALFGALAIWAASLFGISRSMRPSVPLGSRFS